MSNTPDEVQIDDPEDYGSSQRLRQIYEARRELRDIRREAAVHRHDKPLQALSYYRTGVESYLMELDTLFQRNEEGRHLWSREDFGRVRIDPPEPPETANYKINSYSTAEPKVFEIRGLETLFEVDTQITHVFEFEEQHELIGAETKKVERSAPIPWNTLNKMVSAANRYVSDLGIGLEISQTDEWKI